MIGNQVNRSQIGCSVFPNNFYWVESNNFSNSKPRWKARRVPSIRVLIFIIARTAPPSRMPERIPRCMLAFLLGERPRRQRSPVFHAFFSRGARRLGSSSISSYEPLPLLAKNITSRLSHCPLRTTRILRLFFFEASGARRSQGYLSESPCSSPKRLHFILW